MWDYVGFLIFDFFPSQHDSNFVQGLRPRMQQAWAYCQTPYANGALQMPRNAV